MSKSIPTNRKFRLGEDMYSLINSLSVEEVANCVYWTLITDIYNQNQIIMTVDIIKYIGKYHE